MAGSVNTETSPAEKLALFKEAYYENGGCLKAAYISAGFSENHAATNASKYFANHKDEIITYVNTKIAGYVPTAIGTIVKIMNSETEKGGIRLKAAQDLLDRAGYKPSDKIEIRTEDVDNMSTGDIKEKIRELLQEVDPTLGKLVDLKVIQGGKP